MDMYTILYLKWITNKDLLYSTHKKKNKIKLIFWKKYNLMEVGNKWEISVPSAESCCESKTAPNNVLY